MSIAMASEQLEKIVPRVRADEEEEEEDEPELVDPAVEIKAHCAEDHCAKYKARYAVLWGSWWQHWSRIKRVAF